MLAVDRLLGELERGEALGELLERLLAFEPGQRRAEAVVDAVAEGEVLDVGPADVDAIGVGEARRVAVGRREQGDDALARLDLDVADERGLRGDAAGEVDRAVVAEAAPRRRRAPATGRPPAGPTGRGGGAGRRCRCR